MTIPDLKYVITTIMFFTFGFYIFKSFVNFTIEEDLVKCIYIAKDYMDINDPNNLFVPEKQYNKAMKIINMSFFIYSIYYNFIFMIFPFIKNESFITDGEQNSVNKYKEFDDIYFPDEKADIEEDFEEEENAIPFDEMYPQEFHNDNLNDVVNRI
ncbi:MAG: hypothetical protein LBV08_02860 [Clostridiales bacterium]|jgi:hypothetical protein|nr:hypothetical protein [Clostridiales bacterium]